MTWWLTPVRLCFPEKFVALSEHQFQVGMSVPSITEDPGVISADSMGFIRGLSTLASAFSMLMMVLETVGWDTLKMLASSFSVTLCRW